jgi:hypothetical protein
MLGQIDGFYIAAQVRLIRQVSKKTVLILEGESDGRLFGRFIDNNECQLEIGFGKSNVLEALDLLEDEGVPSVVAIVDADFDRLTGKTYSLDNLFLSDCHDIDLTIFKSKAFERYLFEHADSSLLERHFKSEIELVKDRIARSSLQIAYCRFISEFRSLRINLKI